MAKRALLITLAVLVAAGLIVFSFVAVLAGIGEQHAADNTYVVQFAQPGADCGASEVSFDVTDGETLGCESAGLHPMSDEADFPGFTDAQNEAVTTLANQLGTDGLSPDDQEQIQQRVDQFAATVPAARKPHYDDGVSFGPLWGAGLAWTGVGALAVAVLLILLVRRSGRLKRLRDGQSRRNPGSGSAQAR